MSVFGPKTVDSILANIYKQIDELEIVAEQQQLLFYQNDNKINELLAEQKALTDERDRADRVAAKLRALIDA